VRIHEYCIAMFLWFFANHLYVHQMPNPMSSSNIIDSDWRMNAR
jgi:hypothetical protein